jgi:Asp-tRNA(Asn)/Glu-tRNA(Gln) amidotransferase A subunit family amidase
MDFRQETVVGLAARVRAREISARELTEAAVARIEAVNGRVNAFVAHDFDDALDQADRVDERLGRGEDVGPLAGIPIGVKDLEDAAGFVTTSGSVLHAEDPPAVDDSLLVARLRDAGCVVVGKTNTPEFGWQPDTVNRLFGPTCNPWDTDRSPGGSSGGSAAAVMSGMVPLATGSDGGGSIRIPSSVCGMTGMKPSLGRVPTGGPHPPGWPDLSTRGVMARRARDVVAALAVVVGPDPTDLRSLPLPDVSWTRSIEEIHPPLKIGWSPTLGYAAVDKEVLEVCERAVGVLEDLGTTIEQIPTVFTDDPLTTWLTLTNTFALRTLEPFESSPGWGVVDPGLIGLVESGRETVTPVDLVRAMDAAHVLNCRLVDLFHRVPLLLTPTVAGQTPPVDGRGTIDGEPTGDWVRFTYPFNLTRSPAGTVCAGFTADGMPVGLQVVGPQHADVAVLRLLTLLEDALGLEELPPGP